MKKIIFLLSIFILSSCSITMIQTSNQLDERHPNLSKDQIFVEANLWMIDIFNDAESVIQYSDKEAGVLKGRYVWFYQAPAQYTPEYKFTSTITLYIKDKNIFVTPEEANALNPEEVCLL